MKISALQYARSLYDSVAGKSEKDLGLALKNFVNILGRNRELNRSGEIISAFNDIWSKENGELSAELVSARELGPTARESVTSYLKEKTGARKIILTENIDKKIIGGFVLKYDSKVIDASLQSSLRDLKNKISN